MTLSPTDVATAFRSCFGRAKCVYMATPVTSGKRLWDLARALKCRDITMVKSLAPHDFERDVLTANMLAADALADQLRKIHPFVINPAATLIRGWRQEHYMQLWTRVVSEFADEMYLADGWEYSSGCLQEARLAFINCLPVCNSQGSALDAYECAGTVRRARLSASDLDVSCLADAYAEWDNLCHEQLAVH